MSRLRRRRTEKKCCDLFNRFLALSRSQRFGASLSTFPYTNGIPLHNPSRRAFCGFGVTRHYFVRVYKQTRDGGCCRCWAIDVGSFRWHGAHSAGAEKENYYVAVLVNCMTGGLGGWEDLWCVNIGAFAAGFRDSMSAGTRTCVGTRSYAGAPRHHHSPEQPASTFQRPRPLPSRVFPEHRWATLQKRQFGRAGSNPFQSKLLGDLLIFEAMPFHKSRAGHELHNFFLQLFP